MTAANWTADGMMFPLGAQPTICGDSIFPRRGLVVVGLVHYHAAWVFFMPSASADVDFFSPSLNGSAI